MYNWDKMVIKMFFFYLRMENEVDIQIRDYRPPTAERTIQNIKMLS
jgi:hypothetical protein